METVSEHSFFGLVTGVTKCCMLHLGRFHVACSCQSAVVLPALPHQVQRGERRGLQTSPKALGLCL